MTAPDPTTPAARPGEGVGTAPDATPKIGDVIDFAGVDGLRYRGTITDLRNGAAWVAVPGYPCLFPVLRPFTEAPAHV